MPLSTCEISGSPAHRLMEHDLAETVLGFQGAPQQPLPGYRPRLLSAGAPPGRGRRSLLARSRASQTSGATRARQAGALPYATLRGSTIASVKPFSRASSAVR